MPPLREDDDEIVEASEEEIDDDARANEVDFTGNRHPGAVPALSAAGASCSAPAPPTPSLSQFDTRRVRFATLPASPFKSHPTFSFGQR
jgi:hypothetical protein